MSTVGVLALQGDFAEHISAIQKCGAIAMEIRHSWQLDGVDGLIIPGGESTALAKLTGDNPDPIFDTIRRMISNGLPVYGTCMGSILLAARIENSDQGRLATMNISIKRNAFGPQKNSFEAALHIPELGPKAFPAVFIRAPLITEVADDVVVLARLDEGIVMARQKNMLVTAFHPEITDDMRVHKYFLAMIKNASAAG